MDAEHVISQLQRELDAEVLHQNRKLQMGRLAQLKERLGSIPGIDTLAVHFGDGQQHITLNDQSITIGANAPDEEILKALNLRKIDQIAKTSRHPMSVTGLQSGAFQAKLAELKKRVSDSQNAGIAKIDAVVAEGEKKITEATENVAKKAQSEVDNALQEFAQFTNGGE